MKLRRFLALFLLFFLSGCLRVNTNPKPLFEEVQQEIQTRTCHTPCWDTCADETAFKTCIDEMLKQDLTVDLAVYIALLNNRHLQATYENLGIAKANLVQAGLLKNPIFTYSHRFSTQSSITDLIDISLIENFLEALLIPLKKRVAIAELEAMKAMVMVEILDVFAQTKSAFYAFQATQEIWNLKTLILLATECSYDAAKRLFEAGNIKELELLDNRSIYEQQKIELSDLEIALLEARENLNMLMGLWDDQIFWCSSSLLPMIEEDEYACIDVENCAIAQSLNLEIARHQLKATAAGFGVDTTRLVFPQFDVGPNSERDEGVWYVGPAVALAIPFFDFGQANSALAQAEIFRQWNEYTALAINIRSAARLAKFQVLNAFRQSRYYQKILVPLSEQITYRTLLQYNAMQLGVFHLLAAKQNELMNKIQAVEHLRDYWIARTDLELLLNGHLR